jgi:hypothetical protein
MYFFGSVKLKKNLKYYLIFSMKFVDKLFILDAKHLISFERSLKELSNGISKYRVFHLKKLTK